MKFKPTLLGRMVSMAITTGVVANIAYAQEITISDPSLLKAAPGSVVSTTAKKSSDLYIVQLKGTPGITKARELGELIPNNQLVALGRNNYNATSPNITAYTQALREKQQQVASEAGSFEILHSYAHTFNGFSAKLSKSQAEALQSHPDVAAVYQDELHTPATVNTPEFLGLTGPGGQHNLDIKGEDIIIGILDTGIWPENPSFADDGSYTDPADLGWTGACDIGEEAGAGENGEDTFACNNKLIGARYYDASFSSTYDIRYDLGEFDSPRDADGHGSHTAGTAAGNAGVAASINGFDAGTASGMAPRARVAAYKVCWNSNYVSPEGVNERGCFFGDSMAAIDDAVEDGVDVLNYSIGNSNDLDTPVYNAALRAAEAGVFFAGSAGNSGPGPETTSNIAPWITTVAASTYDGESVLVGSELEVTVNDAEQDPILSVHGGITAPIPAEGFSGELAAAAPALGCDPLTNPAEIAGKVALIARGTCNFSDKVLNAQDAGATGIVVYSDARTPIAMGGEGTGITIPGVMIENSTGLDLSAQLAGGAEISVNMTFEPVSSVITETGNVMAGFSSRGQNPQTGDILKPDITAPGVQILAATSTDMLDIPGNFDGESFAYLSGTSMSGPHIAGLAALLMGENPTWSPAQVKSALMTTARQNVVKEDGTTPSDPFDFGAGHVDPVPSMEPGLTYDTNVGDYFGFLCGQGEESMVLSNSGESCEFWEEQGFATDASQLNYPSISIESLDQPETIYRTLTDVSGNGGDYTVSIEAPEGIDVSVQTFDADGVETESDNLVVDAGGKASYALTLTKTESFVPEQYVFGAITLTNIDGTVVRSPIAVKPAADKLIDVPERVSLQLNRGRASFPVQTYYTGAMSIDYAGLVPAFGLQGTVPDKAGAAFDFDIAIEDGTYHLLTMPEGTKVARFNLVDSLVSGEGTDLDLHVWECKTGLACRPVDASENGGSNEEVLLVNPEPRDGTGLNFYVVLVHGYSTNGADTVDYVAPTWIVEGADSTTRVSASRYAVEGRFSSVRLSTRGLAPEFLYMGGVTFYNAEGEAEGTTVLEVQP